MLSKSEIKMYSSLKVKKYRSKAGKFLVEGLKQADEGINSEWNCEVIIFTEEFEKSNQEFIRSLNSKDIRTGVVSSKDFERISDTKSPQGIIGIFHFRETTVKNFIPNSSILFLENISDPGNLGTILRSCDWFGFKNVLLSEQCADVYSPKVVRSTMGSLFHLNLVEVDDYLDVLIKLKQKDYEIICTDTEGQSYKSLNYKPNSVMVLSSESHGPSEEILKISDRKITIDKYGSAESLNVASAAAVLLAELAHSLKIS